MGGGGEPTVPQEPLGKDGKQILTLRVTVLREGLRTQSPLIPPAPSAVGTTHTQTPAASEMNTHTHTHPHSDLDPIFKQNDTHTPHSVVYLKKKPRWISTDFPSYITQDGNYKYNYIH